MTTKRITTPEQDRIVHNQFHMKGVGNYKVLQQFFLEEFGIDMTMNQIKNYCGRKKLTLGVQSQTFFKKEHSPANKGEKMPEDVYKQCSRTMFKKGNIPLNHRPLGSTRVTKDGYIEIKVAEPNKWRLNHRVVWEENTGEKLQRGEVVIFLDGNRQNCNFENLAKITRSQLTRVNQNHLLSDIPEISEVGITLAKLIELKHKRRKK